MKIQRFIRGQLTWKYLCHANKSNVWCVILSKLKWYSCLYVVTCQYPIPFAFFLFTIVEVMVDLKRFIILCDLSLSKSFCWRRKKRWQWQIIPLAWKWSKIFRKTETWSHFHSCHDILSLHSWNKMLDKSCRNKLDKFRFDIWYAVKHVVAISTKRAT